MPSYAVACSCGYQTTIRLSFAAYDAHKGGQEIPTPCGNCGERSLRVGFDPATALVGFTLREGESGGWTSKSIRENAYRQGRSQVMAQREKDHVRVNQLVPNYQGEEGHSWKDIQDHVRSTKGEAAAATYDPLVSKE